MTLKSHSYQNRKHFLLNLVSQYGMTVFIALLGFVSAPISLFYWKSEMYGMWAIITSIAAYLSASGLGIDVAAGILMTKSSSEAQKKVIFWRSFLMVTIAAATLASFFLVIDFYGFDWVRGLGKMSPENVKPVHEAARILVISFFICLPLSVAGNAFGAYGKLFIANILSATQALGLFLVLLFVVRFHGSISSYAFGFALVSILIGVTKILVLFNLQRKSKERALYEAGTVTGNGYLVIVKTGLRLSMYGMAILVSSNATNLIISNTIGPSGVTPFSIAIKLYMTAFIFVSAFNLSSVPLFGREMSKNNWPWIAANYRYFVGLSAILGGAIWIGGTLFLKEIVNLWVGESGYPGSVTTTLLGAWVYTYSLANINYVVIMALNLTRGVAIISWLEVAVMVGVSLSLQSQLGIAGVAVGMVAGALVISMWALPMHIHRDTGKRLYYDVHTVVFVGVLSSGVSVAYGFLPEEFAALPWFLLARIAIFFAYIWLSVSMLPISTKTFFYGQTARLFTKKRI